jgi:hypothetical protein
MKKNIIIGTLLLSGFTILTSCHDLNLNPLSNGSTDTWYSSETEIQMAVNDLYRIDFWVQDEGGVGGTDWSDDRVYREQLTAFQNATLNGQNSAVTDLWAKQYKVIARANSVILKADRAIKNGASANKVNQLVGEARFHRGCAYSKLICKFGDVPLVEGELSIDEGLQQGRTDKATVLQFIYDDFDAAASVLPTSVSGQRRATKGAALAFKARIALYMGDYNTAATASKAVMDLGVYKLHSNYGNLFLSSTKNSEESVFLIPRSIEYKVYVNIRGQLPRNSGGYAVPDPTWDLLASYTCTDGLPIDKSPLFDPHNPFKNRDPRCAMTIVPFGETFLGIEFNPNPQALQVMNYNTGKMIKNNDTRANAQYASFNGLVWKKGVDEDALKNSGNIEPDYIVMRYADVLLMYAEAKIELNQIDQSVLDAMNTVRARAYGVDKSATDKYPAFTSMDQKTLRTQLRTERRVEFANEGLRYQDLVRWKIMNIAMSKKEYMMLYPSTLLLEKVVNNGDWFWPFAPNIDENGLADFTKMEAAGKCAAMSEKKWDDRQYLWPIPTTEIQINPNMTQNPGY